MQLPDPRGSMTRRLFTALLADGREPVELPVDVPESADILTDDDAQLALYACYQLHFQGFDNVDDRWEWHPAVLSFRAAVEARFERALRDAVMLPARVTPEGVPQTLAQLIADQGGPSLSQFILRQASLDQFRELLIHRSLYHLREADPHTFAIPRLAGRPKAALIEIQIDEYGGGQLHRMHAELFRDTMTHLGLDTTPNAYLEQVPAITLATNNVMSMFGLHRRLRGALLGQLAVFEMNSSLPNRRYGNGLRRLGSYPPAATRFFDEHVEADAVHEQIAAHDMCAAFCAAEPTQTQMVLFGAAAWLAIETRMNEHLFERWQRGQTSLRISDQADATV